MYQWKRIWRGYALALGVLVLAAAATFVVPGMTRSAEAATKTVWIPSRWQSTGEVPWVQSRTKESANFILLWGDRSGTDPRNAPGEARFDPDNVLSQLETLYNFYVNSMKFTPETGLLAQHKIIVIITRTWSNAPLDAWATGGSTDGRVGVINIAPGAAQPGSWGLAHELAHVFQNYTFLGRSGVGFTNASAGSFWETSAEFMSMQVYPNTAAGDLTRFLRTENLAYSSSRHHYGNWMLVQYIVDKHGGVPMFNRIWNEARNTEHPLETYRRISGISQAELNAQMAEYAQHQVTYDYSNRSSFMPFINNMYGAGFINAYNGVPVDAVNQSTGHYAIPDALAPSDYGYNKIKLVPSTDGGLIQLHLKGHVNAAAQSGWSYGFVAVKNGVPRYGPVTTAPDSTISFQTQPGERDVYLVVVGAPATVHHYAFLDGYTKNYRYPYEFRVAGAVPSGYEPGYVKPAATGGGRWHSNGGGWVSNQANVASTAYVGPRAAVYGNSTVSGNARIEGLAWVNSGATVGGNAVVKDNAIIQGGANLSGSIVVGGDAELANTCGSGTYLLFNPDRGCDGRGGETDVNPAHGRFTDAELAIGGTNPSPSGSSSPSPSASVSPSASASPSPSVSRSPGGPGGASCTAAYKIVGQWQGGFQGEVAVTAGNSAISGWTVTWTYADGQAVTQSWGATVTASGSAVTAQNAAYNGTVPAGTSTTFGFIGSSGATNRAPAVTCSAR
jgi:carbonic anhydrase/acetyltransferase-like protein (isoleucine patch superfamily)